MTKRKTYTSQFKREAVWLMEEQSRRVRSSMLADDCLPWGSRAHLICEYCSFCVLRSEAQLLIRKSRARSNNLVAAFRTELGSGFVGRVTICALVFGP